MKKMLIIAAMAAIGAAAQATIYSFDVFTTNGVYGDNPGLNLWADVSSGAVNDGTATFTFYNESLFDCAISEIYFDDGTLLGISIISNGPGTEFFTGGNNGVNPGNLPAGNNLTPPFEATQSFSIEPTNPEPQNGVNTGEWVSITFDLIDGQNLPDVLDSIESGALRVGIHVQAFPGGNSESALMIPEPATALTLALGGLIIAGYRRFFGRF